MAGHNGTKASTALSATSEDGFDQAADYFMIDESDDVCLHGKQSIERRIPNMRLKRIILMLVLYLNAAFICAQGRFDPNKVRLENA